jgi:hypothetical protein
MRFKLMHYAVAALAMAAGSSYAQDYVKIGGADVDFYYDADFWTLGATVSGNTISVRPGDVYQRADVTEGAADPYQGPVYTAALEFSRSYARSVIAVAHPGYYLNNDIASTASATLQSNGSSGYASYDLVKSYTSGTFSGGAFTPGAEIGGNVEWAYFYYQLYNGGSDSGYSELQLTTPLTAYSAIAVNGTFHGTASVTGLGTAAVGLDRVSYSFGVSPVPEPEQYAMLGLGLALLGMAARRRRTRSQA